MLASSEGGVSQRGVLLAPPKINDDPRNRGLKMAVCSGISSGLSYRKLKKKGNPKD